MDPEGDSKTQRQGKKISLIQGYLANVSDVLSPLWIRRPLQVIDGNNWLILGCRYNFLLYLRLFLVILYCVVTNSI